MASSKSPSKPKMVTFSVRASQALYEYLIQRAQAAGMNRAEMMRLLLSLPIAVSPKTLCDPQKLIRATVDGPCKNPIDEASCVSPADPLFGVDDGMLTAPENARLESYNGCLTADEIDGINPVWASPEELLESDDSQSLVSASFVLGKGEQILPFAVIDKNTGAIFASRAQPPIALLTNADVAILEANIQALAEKASTLSDVITILVQRYTLAARGYEIPDSKTVANLLVDMISELGSMQGQMGDIVRYAKSIADTPRICVTDESKKKSRKRGRPKAVRDSDLKEVPSKTFG